jgi:hypothetical protein
VAGAGLLLLDFGWALAIVFTTVKFRFGAGDLLPNAWGRLLCPFGARHGFGCVGCCVLLKCESGSGASLGVLRSAKSDRMCGCSDVSASETAAFAFRGVE